jgi:beta-galactosidase GanA
MTVRPRIAALTLVLLLASFQLSAQTAANPTTDPSFPHIDHSGAHPTLIVDGAPFLMLGAQVNNSSAFASEMPKVWPVMDELGVNTVEAPIYWEQLEPQQGQFDYSSIDMLLTQARAHHVHLVLLWFGTWKNGSPGYAPAWIKQDQTRYPLSTNAQGKQFFSLSPFGEHTLAADQTAFTALMQHLKTADPEHTVILVQVENESGMWGNSRDHSPAAEKAFAAPVPALVRQAMGTTATGDWTEVFGPDADEYFSAWAIAVYINQVAAAGKAVDPLPMYVNAALRDPSGKGGQGSFESGAPVFDALPLWHALTPAIDAIAPDIYMPQYDKYMAVIHQYALPWNPFFIPETGNSRVFAHYFFAALGAGAFGWSPFGMDRTGYVNYPLGAAAIDAETLAPFALNYTLVAPMMRELARLNGEGSVRGVAEPPDVHAQTIAFGPVQGKPAGWTAEVSYGLPAFYTTKPAPGNPEPEGEALIAQLGPDEFLVTGVHCRVDFHSTLAGPRQQRMWLRVEEGTFVEGKWQTSRLWNGDQTDYGLNFTDQLQVLRVKLTRY